MLNVDASTAVEIALGWCRVGIIRTYIYVILSKHTRDLTTEANGENVKNPSLTRGLDISRIWQV